jgi:hypothetical protein
LAFATSLFHSFLFPITSFQFFTLSTCISLRMRLKLLHYITSKFLFQIHGTFGRYTEYSTVRIIPDFLICDVFGRLLHCHGIQLTFNIFNDFSIYIHKPDIKQ